MQTDRQAEVGAPVEPEPPPAAKDVPPEVKPSEASAADGSAPAQFAIGPADDALRKHVDGAVEKILASFAHRFAVNTQRERLFGSLHDELQKYRDDVLSKAMRPLIQAVIQMHDDMGRTIERLAKAETPPSADHVMRTVKGFQDGILLTLEQNGVDMFSERNDGGDFNGRRQRVVDYRDAPSPELIGKVASSLRPGFESGSLVIQRERVVVYRKAPAPIPGAPVAAPSNPEIADTGPSTA